MEAAKQAKSMGMTVVMDGGTLRKGSRELAELVYGAMFILLPWPGAIGYRRFYQGILIRGNRTRRLEGRPQ